MSQECEKVRELMETTLGQPWTDRDVERIHLHQKVCPDCTQLWEEYLEISRGMDALEKLSSPSEVSLKKILNASEPPARKSRRFSVGPVWAFLLSRPFRVAAMLLLIVGVGFYSKKWLETHRSPSELAPLPVQPQLLGTEPQGLVLPLSPPAKPLVKERRESADEGLKRRAMEKLDSRSGAGALPALSAAPPPIGGSPAKSEAAPEEAMDAKKDERAPEASPAKPAQEEISPDLKRQQELIIAAKAKIQMQDYAGAMEDLLKAQKIKDLEEIRTLIAQCREKLQQNGAIPP